MTGMSIGTSLALATTVPLFGTDWRNAFLSVGIVIAILIIIWFVLAKDKPAGIEIPNPQEVSMKAGLGLAIKSRNVWLLGVMTAKLLARLLP